MKVMVIGSGGREHAIAHALVKSDLVNTVYCVPGNGGTATQDKCENIEVRGADSALYSQIARDRGVDLVIVGPEDPLAAGVSDILRDGGKLSVGPGREAATLESSKDFAKAFMKKHGVACADSRTFTSSKDALAYLENAKMPIVVKADGLAAGKGVVIADDLTQAKNAVRNFMDDRVLGDAGSKVVLESVLSGREVSILCAVSIKDGEGEIVPFLPARDHKRVGDGDIGPNTGGMGAIAPVPDWTKEINDKFIKDCLTPTLEGIKKDFGDYRGFLFFGLIITDSGPKVLEYNVRLGDPETQAVLPLLKSDFAVLCNAIAKGEKIPPLEWKDGWTVAPVIVSRGYPGKYKKDLLLSIDNDRMISNNAKVYFAGAKLTDKGMVTTGGRVLCCAARGETLEDARQRAYNAIDAVSFEGATFRHDIGKS